MQNIDPALLQELLALQNVGPDQLGAYYGGVDSWLQHPSNTNSNNGWRLNRQRGTRQLFGGDQEQVVADPSQDQFWISKVREDTGGNLGDRWNLDGTYRDTFEANNGGGRDLNTAIALMAAGYFGGNYAFGDGGLSAGGAAAGGATGSGMTASQQAAMMAANGMTDAEIAAALGSQGAQAAGLTGVTGGAAAGGSAAGGAGSGLTGSQLASGAKTAYDAIGGGQGVAALLGAAAGAADSGDKTQTTSRDPWAPMQPYLKGLAQEGADLYAKLKAQPFSQAQQTAYGNVGGLLDSLNQALPGLLSAQQMTAGGQNQFRRGQQNSIPTYGWSGLNWQPGLLGNFGTKG